MKKNNKLLAVFLLCILIITACKVDEDKKPIIDNKEIQEKILQLEQEEKIPSNLDRTNYLLGIDANNNGVRDDVEKWIEKKYPNQIKETMQFARSMQGLMGLDTSDELAVRKANLAEVRAIKCLFVKNKDEQLITKIFKEVSSITTNTKERVLAEIRYAKAMSGKVLSTTKDEDACDE